MSADEYELVESIKKATHDRYEEICEEAWSSNTGQIVKSGISELPEVYSQSDVKECLSVLQRVTKLLKAIGEYENSLFALIQLEISAFEKIVEFTDSYDGNLFEITNVKGVEKRYKDAVTIYAKATKDERDLFKESAMSCGQSFVSFVASCASKKKNEDFANRVQTVSDSILSNFLDGEANVSIDIEDYVKPSSNIQRRIVSAEKDKLKDRLLRSGAVGIGDGEYVNPFTAEIDEVLNALLIRINSCIKDVEKISVLYNIAISKGFNASSLNSKQASFLKLIEVI